MSTDPGLRDQLRRRLTRAVDRYHHHASLPTPVLVADVDAFDANARDLVQHAGQRPVRVTSGALRVPALIRLALLHAGMSGVLASSLREALWLREHDLSDDIVVRTPTIDRDALATLATRPSDARAITLTIDSSEHLALVDACRTDHTISIRVAIDIDSASRIQGLMADPASVDAGDVERLVDLAREVHHRSGFELAGLITDERHVATPGTVVSGRRARALLVRRLTTASTSQLQARRHQIVTSVTALGPLDFVIATGSTCPNATAMDPTVTELADPGVLAPSPADHCESFDPRPVVFAGLPVIRPPRATDVTVLDENVLLTGVDTEGGPPRSWAPAGLR